MVNVISSDAPTELIAVGIQPGEMLLEAVQQAVKDKDVRNGVVVSGVGTLKNLHMHYITHTDFPPTDEFVNIERPLELLAVSGIIADGEPHLHVVVSSRTEGVWAGHLEPESELLYLAEVAILKCNELNLARHLDSERKIKL
ncbi:MAG: hypothetical protein AMS16_05965, partial [Planctomycetes bacterium DG_58]